MDDLERFTSFLFDGLEGYVYSPVKKPDAFTTAFFHWPEQRQELHDWIKTSAVEYDVYLSPAVYSEKRAIKETVKETQVVWVEFDGPGKQIDFRDLPKPNAIVQTSTDSHVHCYWRIDAGKSDAVEDINYRLTYYLDADSSGFDVTQLLRPPTTTNFKPEYDSPLPVELTYLEPTGTIELTRFDVAPRIQIKKTEITESQLAGLEANKILAELPIAVIKKCKLENPVHPYRSEYLTSCAYELAEEGLEHLQIVAVLKYIDERIRKYAGRADQLTRLSSIADKAIHKINFEEALQVYTLKDALEHTEDLEWIIPGWLHKQGLLIVTGAPNVGKTQFCLQLCVQAVKGEAFLELEFLDSIKLSTLFMSLEMDIRSLKYFLKLQSNEWGSIDYLRFSLIDQEATLVQYENLIASTHPTIICIDSLSELLPDEDNPNAEGKKVMRWLKKIRRRYNLAVILIHHNRKASVGNKKPKNLEDLSGTYHFARLVDTVLCLWEDSNGTEVSEIKARFKKKEAFYIERNDDTLWFSRKHDTGKKSGTVVSIDGLDTTITLDFG